MVSKNVNDNRLGKGWGNVPIKTESLELCLQWRSTTKDSGDFVLSKVDDGRETSEKKYSFKLYLNTNNNLYTKRVMSH